MLASMPRPNTRSTRQSTGKEHDATKIAVGTSMFEELTLPQRPSSSSSTGICLESTEVVHEPFSSDIGTLSDPPDEPIPPFSLNLSEQLPLQDPDPPSISTLPNEPTSISKPAGARRKRPPPRVAFPNLAQRQVEENILLSSELSDLPSLNDLDIHPQDEDETRSSDSSTATISNLPPILTADVGRAGPVRKSQRQAMFPALRRQQEEEEKRQQENERRAQLQARRKRARQSQYSIDISTEANEEVRARKRVKDWNNPTSEHKETMFKDLTKYIHSKYQVSLEWFFNEMMFSASAANWRATFKKSFVSDSKSVDADSPICWADEVVREQLRATQYRAILPQLRKELFSYGAHLRAQLKEGLPTNNLVPGTREPTTSQSNSTAQTWRDHLLAPLGVNTLADIAQVKTVQEVAPSWYYILSSASSSIARSRGDTVPVPSLVNTRNPQWVGSLVATLCGKLQPRKAAILGRIIGLFVWSQGLSRLGIDFLYHLGVCRSYDTINRSLHTAEKHHAAILTSMGKSLNRVVCYDNIQFKQGVRDISVGDEAKFHSFTTGFVKISPFIPPSGIRRDQYHPGTQLRKVHVWNVFERIREEATKYDLEDQLWKYYIFTSLRQVFPQIQTQPRSEGDSGQDDTVTWDLPGTDSCLPPHVSNTVTLGELFFDEATESGNVEIKRDIHLRQFGLDASDSQWKDNLFLVFGDAMTAQRIQIMQSSLIMCDSDFDRAQWILPVIGLWHLRFNYVDLLVEHHFTGPGDDTSTLYHAWHTVFSSRNVKKKNFDQMHKLIENTFNAKLIALVLEYLKQHEVEILTLLSQIPQLSGNTSFLNSAHLNSPRAGLPGLARMDYTQVSEWMYLLPTKVIDQAIRWGHEQIGTVYRGTYGSEPTRLDELNEEEDREFGNNVRFLGNVMPYMALSNAIKTGNISLLRWALKATLIIFCGAPKRTTYQYELCRLVWLTCTSATDTQLADIILKESLVNTQGGKDTWYEMDRFNELINFRLRVVNNSRRTTSHQIKRLVTRQLRTDDTLTAMKELVRKHFHVRQDNRHNVKEQRDLLWLLVHEIRQVAGDRPSALSNTPRRVTATVNHNLHISGLEQLSRVIKRFNNIQKDWQAGRGSDLVDSLPGVNQADVIAEMLNDIMVESNQDDDEPPSAEDIMREQEILQLYNPDTDKFINVFQSDLDGSQARNLHKYSELVQGHPNFEDDIDVGDEINHAVSSTVLADPLNQISQDTTTAPTDSQEDGFVEGLNTQQEALESQTFLATYEGDDFDSDDEADAIPGPEIEQLDHLFDDIYESEMFQ